MFGEKTLNKPMLWCQGKARPRGKVSGPDGQTEEWQRQQPWVGRLSRGKRVLSYHLCRIRGQMSSRAQGRWSRGVTALEEGAGGGSALECARAMHTVSSSQWDKPGRRRSVPLPLWADMGGQAQRGGLEPGPSEGHAPHQHPPRRRQHQHPYPESRKSWLARRPGGPGHSILPRRSLGAHQAREAFVTRDSRVPRLALPTGRSFVTSVPGISLEEGRSTSVGRGPAGAHRPAGTSSSLLVSGPSWEDTDWDSPSSDPDSEGLDQ